MLCRMKFLNLTFWMNFFLIRIKQTFCMVYQYWKYIYANKTTWLKNQVISEKRCQIGQLQLTDWLKISLFSIQVFFFFSMFNRISQLQTQIIVVRQWLFFLASIHTRIIIINFKCWQRKWWSCSMYETVIRMSTLKLNFTCARSTVC